VTACILGLATGGAVLYRQLPFLVAREAIAAGESTTIGAGPRDAVFFRRGWLPARTDGNVTARVSDGARATLHVPLPSGRPYGLVFRLDPVTPSAPTQIAVLLNRRLVGHLDLRWDPERVGAYTLPLPAGLVGRGDNDLELVADAAIPAGDAEPRYAFLPPTRPIAFRLWHLRIVPGTAGGS
jgi:hypothetical protein